MTQTGARRTLRGRLRVAHGRGLLARALIRLLRLPRASDAAEVRVDIVPHADGERWCRTFDGVRVTTWQSTPEPNVLVERFGCLEFRFRVVRDRLERRYEQMRVSTRIGKLALRLPRAIAPSVDGRERAQGANVSEVRVRVSWPPAGLILEYDGDVHLEDHA